MTEQPILYENKSNPVEFGMILALFGEKKNAPSFGQLMRNSKRRLLQTVSFGSGMYWLQTEYFSVFALDIYVLSVCCFEKKQNNFLKLLVFFITRSSISHPFADFCDSRHLKQEQHGITTDYLLKRFHLRQFFSMNDVLAQLLGSSWVHTIHTSNLNY